MYSKVNYIKSRIGGVEKLEGETIETKVERILENNEPITDGAPEIFTERAEGVVSAYNIRTDRWEIATEAMDVVSKSVQAKREEKAKLNKEKKEAKVIDLDKTPGTEKSGTDS